jgi:hypothetical protein
MEFVGAESQGRHGSVAQVHFVEVAFVLALLRYHEPCIVGRPTEAHREELNRAENSPRFACWIAHHDIEGVEMFHAKPGDLLSVV